MARLCSQCGEIHFETSGSPLPLQCRKCNADLNGVSGLMPSFQHDEVEASRGTPRQTIKQLFKRWSGVRGFGGIVAGCVVLLTAAAMLFLGYDWHTRVKEVTATVHPSTDAPKWAKRDRLSATYVVGTKKYPQYPGLRREGDTFPVYYLPEDPATGYETKPFLWLLIGGGVALIGVGVLTFGFFRFGISRAQIADFEQTMAQAS
ncbi:MAG: hypothetical protein MUF18_11435 [Fimbriiglobus sp.]|nr:hypothetical protein [Fimbriiglobus sp.]